MKIEPIIRGFAFVASAQLFACGNGNGSTNVGNSSLPGNGGGNFGTGSTSGTNHQSNLNSFGGTDTSNSSGGTNSSNNSVGSVGSTVSGGVSSTASTSPIGGTLNVGGGTSSTGGTRNTGGTTSQSTSTAPVVDRPTVDTEWSKGLKTAANGPIPWIVVDQFGYRTNDQKVAVIRSPQTGYDSNAAFTPGSKYSVVSKSTGKSVKDGTLTPWNGGATDATSGDKAWWFDFSDITTPGTYTIVDSEKNVRSVEFEIADDVYRSVLKHAVRMFFYQRAGFAKTTAYAGADWSDGACLLGKGQDSEAHAWTAKTDESLVRDLRGGWFDAGDLNRYTAWAAGTAITLLHAFEENPSAFGDDFGIPESGNKVPDLLDEVKYAIDWVVRMQNADGSLLCILGSDGASPPSATTGASYYGPATTNASLMGAALFAYASKVYGARPETNFKTFAADLKARATKAWNWAESNPNVTYYNNDNSKQPGSGGLGAGGQETDDTGRLISKFQAATHLFEITGDSSYKSFAETNWTKVVGSSGPTEWDMEKADAVMYLARLPNVTPSIATAITNQVVTNVTNSANQMGAVTSKTDPYRAYLKDYTWSSNQIKMAQARLLQYVANYGSSAIAPKAAAAAADYVHYLHGVNPLGLVYVTNMAKAGAEHSAKTMFHTWFADKSPKWDETTATTPGPAPGFLTGGPNPSFAPDGCCTAPQGDPAYQCYGSSDFAMCSWDFTPPMGQPQQKAYLEYNGGWPVGSWPITEPSTGYQAKYVLVLSALAR
jgi:hypothetical protein